LPWLIGGAVVVVAAVAVTLVLTTGDDDSGDQRAGATSTPTSPRNDTPTSAGEPGTAYDLSTPEAAAESFVTVARTGSGPALLELSCVGHLTCVTEHIPGATDAQITEGRDQISEGVYELAEHLKEAEFGTAVDGPAPGTKAVPYRTPAMAGDASLTLTFIQSEGDWLYYNPAA
jgi:hypothetical protein